MKEEDSVRPEEGQGSSSSPKTKEGYVGKQRKLTC